MTIRVTIKNCDEGRPVEVVETTYPRPEPFGSAVFSPMKDSTLLKPGEERSFYVHQLKTATISEGPVR